MVRPLVRKIIGIVGITIIITSLAGWHFISRQEMIFPLYLNTYSSPALFFEAIADATNYDQDGNPGNYPIHGAIVPHHLTAATSIARVFAALSHQKVRHIILLSPDHFFRCPNMLCVTDGTFKTLFGDVSSNVDNIKKLLSSEKISKETQLFQREHGIFSVLPFLNYYLPDADVTPIVLAQKHRIDWENHREEVLGSISSLASPDTVFMVSSDFSHYLNLSDADRHDEETAAALFAPDPDKLLRLRNPENSDCPNCLWLLTKIALEHDFFNPALVAHTNSARILANPSLKETTSHFGVLYYKNAKLSDNDVAFAGDVTLVRANKPNLSETVLNFWSGTGPRIVNLETPLAETCTPEQNPYLFCSTETDWGSITDLATIWGLKNNHMLDTGREGPQKTVKLIADHQEIPLDDQFENKELRVIPLTLVMNPVLAANGFDVKKEYENVVDQLQQHQDDKLTVVFMHAGEEFKSLPNHELLEKLKSFIDAGADAVIATHPHLPGPMIIHQGKPIFTSLGNFVFDQDQRIETQTALAVRLRKNGDKILFQTLHSR